MANNYNNLQEGKELEVMNAIIDIKKAAEVLGQYSGKFVSLGMDEFGWLDMQDIASNLKSLFEDCEREAAYRSDREFKGCPEYFNDLEEKLND